MPECTVIEGQQDWLLLFYLRTVDAGRETCTRISIADRGNSTWERQLVRGVTPMETGSPRERRERTNLLLEGRRPSDRIRCRGKSRETVGMRGPAPSSGRWYQFLLEKSESIEKLSNVYLTLSQIILPRKTFSIFPTSSYHPIKSLLFLRIHTQRSHPWHQFPNMLLFCGSCHPFLQ